MAFTATQLAALEAAIATGELTVEIDGKRVTYRSIADLLKARDVLKSDLDAGAGTSRVSRSWVQRVRQ